MTVILSYQLSRLYDYPGHCGLSKLIDDAQNDCNTVKPVACHGLFNDINLS